MYRINYLQEKIRLKNDWWINLTSSFVSSPPPTVRDFGWLRPGSGARGWSLEAASSKRGDSAGGQGRGWTPRLGRAGPRVRDDHEAGPPVGPRGRRGRGRDLVGLGCTRRGWRYRGGWQVIGCREHPERRRSLSMAVLETPHPFEAPKL